MVKHAWATPATVDVEVDGRNLMIVVDDDGRGGTDARYGSGLTGLLDRVEAGNGGLTVTSRAGGGSMVRATLPINSEPSGPMAP